jgi:mRNA-degrading endonuclease YafQ of YafQ-DinJ toxin-antitoxin module
VFTLVSTPAFEKQARKFITAHPDLKLRVAAVLRQLEKDPSHPSLRLHPLRGELKGIHAVRINYTYRITLVLRLTQKEIQLLDIGSHDAVYR